MADKALGIDIGGTNTKAGLVTLDGEISHFQKMPTDAHGSDPAPFLARLFDLVDPVFAEAKGSLIGIGVSMHGAQADDRSGPIACNNTPALRGLNMRGTLEQRYGLPVVVNNDLTAHGLAEYRFGSGRGVKRFMCFAIGTGLGAGVILNGEALRFNGGTAGDTGRMIIDPEGEPDVYGARGSAEGLCGVVGIERLARQRYGHDVPAHEVIAAARAGSDPTAVAVIQQIGSYLGLALANLAMVFMPDKIALTGGTAEAGQVLLDAVKTRFESIVGDYHRNIAQLIPDYDGVEIVLGESRGETGVLGAVVELFPSDNHSG